MTKPDVDSDAQRHDLDNIKRRKSVPMPKDDGTVFVPLWPAERDWLVAKAELAEKLVTTLEGYDMIPVEIGNMLRAYRKLEDGDATR